jgi:hypothetical protein
MEKTLQILSFVVLALMLASIVYAAAISALHWTGIGV